VGRPVGKRQLGKPTRKWEDNIKSGSSRSRMARHIDWIALSQDKDSRREFLNAVMNLQVP